MSGAFQPAQATPPSRPPSSATIGKTLERLRESSDNASLIESIPAELCRAGFGRAMYSAIEYNTWVTRSVHAVGDPAQAKTLLRLGQHHPRILTPTLLESLMVRSRTPLLVRDPQSNPNVHRVLINAAHTDSYVAAPIYLWNQPVGMLHADKNTTTDQLGIADLDLISILAESIGVIFERNIAVRRMLALQTATREHVREIRSLAALFDECPTAGEPTGTAVARANAEPTDNSDALTQRELQVLRLLQTGATNKQIADDLCIRHGTVKSHVQSILRKLGLHSRAELATR